jgi:hypothetical protein
MDRYLGATGLPYIQTEVLPGETVALTDPYIERDLKLMAGVNKRIARGGRHSTDPIRDSPFRVDIATNTVR